jgi:CubicO group peptidase (beta-lactamase class C family)
VTKLFTSTIAAQLRDESRLDWDAPMQQYLPDLDLRGLHVIHGVDYTPRITVRQLLTHTSGLPDYFEGRRRDGSSTFSRLVEQDQAWTLQDVIHWSRNEMKPSFVPGTTNHALYSDTNFQLLGGILERVGGATFAELFRARIANRCGLSNSRIFTCDDMIHYDETAPLRIGRRTLRVPLALASTGADGAGISTLRDGLAFLDAFFSGRLFSRVILLEMQTCWQRIFFPLKYGAGVMRFDVPWYLGGIPSVPPLVGHSGASGALFYRSEKWRMTVVAAVHQLESRSLPYQLLVRALQIVRP